jgi:hypothetical protein
MRRFNNRPKQPVNGNVSVSSVQLTSYFTGYKEIYDLREAVKQKEGKQFNLKAFNENS